MQTKPSLFPPLAHQIRKLMDETPALIDNAFPMPGRFRSALPSDVAELSRLLTSGRGERGLAYLGRPNLLSAYLRYYLPWNLYRLCRLLPSLDLTFSADDYITDLGCGPLTFAAALWICRPDLRSVPLAIRCIDRSGPALDAGRKFFTALAGENHPWKLHTTKGDLNGVKPKPSTLVCAINVFNEMYGDISRSSAGNLRRNAEKSACLLEAHGSASSAILVAEPGFPRCGEFISQLRSVFLRRRRRPVSPCPHDKACPFVKGRWCHFAFDTEDAPAA
ncbi:MAG: small ribosomal subunit Rsm22 family protein, partial [Treponema sp.]|nr:small ribosomal subunit Rsm22 family protein [Treponema sp.]